MGNKHPGCNPQAEQHSITAQVVKDCEPIFIFMLGMFLYNAQVTTDRSTLFLIMVIVALLQGPILQCGGGGGHYVQRVGTK